MTLKDLFYFNKSDRRVLLFLLFLGFGAAIFMFLSDQSGDSTEPMVWNDSLVSRPLSGDVEGGRKPRQWYGPVSERHVERFPFDPNTVDSTDLLRLGLQPWQVRNVYKYRAAGGVYRKPIDFARLYGLTRKQYLELEPYIRISGDYRSALTLVSERSPEAATERDTVRYPAKIKATEHVPLNAADTSLLKRVPGIGSYYARQIVNYRTRLGGFHSPRQLLEIDDFPEEALPYFTLSGDQQPPLRRMAINKLTLNQLKRHPYMGYYRARAITDYRRLKGPIRHLDDLKMLPDFTPEAIARLEPYVSYEE